MQNESFWKVLSLLQDHDFSVLVLFGRSTFLMIILPLPSDAQESVQY
jgi:hypothetical protein